MENTYIRKAFRYIILFLILYISTMNIPTEKISNKDGIIISTIGVVSFCILDMLYPTIYIKSNQNI